MPCPLRRPRKTTEAAAASDDPNSTAPEQCDEASAQGSGTIKRKQPQSRIIQGPALRSKRLADRRSPSAEPSAEPLASRSVNVQVSAPESTRGAARVQQSRKTKAVAKDRRIIGQGRESSVLTTSEENKGVCMAKITGASQAITRSTIRSGAARVQEQELRRKFDEVDQWKLSFEEVSSPFYSDP